LEASSVAGKGGAVTLTATNSLEIDGSRVSSDTNGSFDGGNVTLTANSILIQGSTTPDGSTAAAMISSDALGSGNAGNVTLNASSILIRDEGFVTSEASGGNGGNVTLT